MLIGWRQDQASESGISGAWRWGSGAPKGRKDSAQGFNPGFGVAKGCALKVAPEDRRCREDMEPPQTIPAATNSCASFRAHFVKTPNPGLKLRAESCCSFCAIFVSRQR